MQYSLNSKEENKDSLLQQLKLVWFQVLALCLVGGFAIYHSVLHATYDVTPCKGLLKDGMYKVTTIYYNTSAL